MTAGFVPAPVTVSKTAAEDLSAKKYYACKLNSSGQVAAISATTDVPYGIITGWYDDGVTNDAIDIAPVNGGGSAYIYLSGTIASAALITVDATGAASADAATNYNIGQLESGGAVGELGVVRLGNITVKA
jgi:hypothetical protein